MKALLLAGEQSGMIYAEALKVILAQKGVETRGFADYGFNVSDMAVMGILPVIMKLPYFLRVIRTMKRAMIEWRPDVVCTVDYPGMNLKLSAYAKSLGIRTVHVVSPQVWAWKKGRIPRIERSLDSLMCFFPFEPALYKPGFAHFAGHPLCEMAEADASVRSREKGLVAILPGSRLGEISRNLPVMLEALGKLKGVRAEIPAANPAARKAIEAMLATSGAKNCTVLDGNARSILARAEVAAVASGTATLEAALLKCPTVLVYRVNALFAFLARRFIKEIKHVGLANIVWEKMVPGNEDYPMPELLQEDFTAEALASLLGEWLENPDAKARIVARLEAACALLRTEGGALERIAREITKG